MSKWLAEIAKQQHLADATKILVGNKKDMEDKRQVALVEGTDLAS